MRTFLSYFGLALVGVALMLLGADMITSLEHPGQITLRSFLDIWADFDRSAVAAFTAWLTKSWPQFAATSVIGALSIPAWSVGVIGVVIAFIAGHKHDGE